MAVDNLRREALENLRLLMNNEYPGRGIIVGRSIDGSRWIQAYWLMGRSENSRNRILVERGTVLKRFHARAKGRGFRIIKPTCHIFVTVGDQPDKRRAKASA